MPITQVEYPHEVRHVQVLDEEGNVDGALEPDIPEDDLRDLYRTMLLVREFDENRLRLQRRGEIGTFAPCKGQEAAQLGSVYAIRKTDWFVPSFRETAAAVWRGMRLEDDLLYAAGFEEGIDIPEDARDLPICIPIGTQICHGVGLAWGSRIQGKDDVAVAYIGDGGTSEGDFHEGMNFAGVYDAPLIVFVQNNHWAISVPRDRQTRSKTIAQKAYAYGFPGVQVDGNDILGVYQVMREAVDRAREGKGPSLIEAVTYRMSVHTTADDPSKYRRSEEVEAWEPRDPIKRFRTYLVNKGVLREEEDETWREEVKGEVKQAVDRFRQKAPKTLDNMFEHIWSELPPYTAAQRDELVAYWERQGIKPEAH